MPQEAMPEPMPDARSMPALSVVIPCFNGAATLAETLDGLVAQVWDRPWEIVLADNGSSDGSVALFQDYARRHPALPMRVIDASDRRGQPHALNTGARAARGQAIAFCDADDVPAPGWLAAMGAALDAHDFVAARMDIETLNPGWMREYRHNAQVSGLETLPFPPYCPHAGGGTLGLRRAVFDAVGEFDHGFPALHDTDFCIRAQLSGYALQYAPAAVMRIRFRPELAAIYRQAYTYAKFAVLLAKRYRTSGAPPRGRWGRFARSWTALGRWYLSKAVLRRPSDLANEARFRRSLGREWGRLTGVLAYRVPPP
jgi:glycosyltransferase involved in cell wall biosynthesis